MAAILIAVTLIGAGGRAIWANGLLAHAPTGFSGTCRTLARVPGVADIEIAGHTAFISVSSARGPSREDGIYALSLNGDGKLTRLAGTPKDFHPRGIGLLPSPNGQGLFLVAVNKRAGGASAPAGATNKGASAPAGATNKGASAPAGVTNKKPSAGGNIRFSIDSFEVVNPQTAPALVAQGTIEGGLLVNPQDVAAAGPGVFYVANGTAAANPVLHTLQTYGVIAGANVLYFNGMTFKVVADGLYGARSLALTPDGQHLIVSGLLSRNLMVFQRESFSGTLTEDKPLGLPAGPQMITVDPQGALWVAAHANLPAWRRFAADPSKPSPSQVFRVSLAGGVPQAARQIYGNAGTQIGGAGVAARAGNRLLIGSALDGRLLDCTLQ
jgi:sugar lactone lactonase YvrE